MYARTPARYLAPLALVGFIVAVVMVVGTVGRSGGGGADKTASRPAATARGHHKPKKHYRVKAGDTLAAIASKAGVPVTQIESLNPNLDPHALQTGQLLKLRR